MSLWSGRRESTLTLAPLAAGTIATRAELGEEEANVSEHPNAVLARQAADALSRGDMQALDDFIADDVIWHEIGRSEPRRGKEELRAVAPGGGGVDYEITGKLHDIIAGDDHTIALVDATATRGSKTLNYRTAEIYHVRDGKIVERWAFSDDTAEITAFFA
jgi:ketosteroid isomerase-like protein